MAHHPETVLSVRAEAMQDKARLSVVEDDGFVWKLLRLRRTYRQGNLHALQLFNLRHLLDTLGRKLTIPQRSYLANDLYMA